MDKTRLYLILYWVCIIILSLAILQNHLNEESILSNDVFILIGIIVILVFLDEVTRSLSEKERMRKELLGEYPRTSYNMQELHNKISDLDDLKDKINKLDDIAEKFTNQT